jgi:hypothetical protein
MGAKKTDKFYSIMNVTNGNILSAALNGVSYSRRNKDKVHTRQRNWKLSQFQVESIDVLDHFINAETIEGRWSMGVHEIWVKEEDIDSLYGTLAMATLRHFCGYAKQKALFGAFLFHKDPKLFIELDFTSRESDGPKILKERKLGKEFLEFLETFGVLSFNRGGHRYVNGKWIHVEEKRSFFSVAEIDLVERERKNIVTTFEYKEEKS